MKINYLVLGDTIPTKGFYRLHPRDTPDLISRTNRESTLVLNLSQVIDKASLIQVLKLQASLPAYCAENWDALEECLGDSINAQVIIVSGIAKLRDANKGVLNTLLSILFDVLANDHLVLLSDGEIAN